MIIIENLDLTSYNSYKIRSECRKAFFPENEKDVIELFLSGERPKYIIGNGNNIILSKKYYEDSFLIFSGSFNSYRVEKNVLEAQSSIDLLSLSEIAYSNNLSGLEIFYDIPSSLGGAIVMNAGASGEDIGSMVIKVQYFDPTIQKIKEISGSNLQLEYRNSFFQRNNHLIILKVWLKLRFESKYKIKRKMDTIKKSRWAKQPRDYPNAGSVFKRPKGYFVGAIIEELGLKGMSIGGAKISEKHGGFIVNYNNATGMDIIHLINYIQKKVKNNYGFYLEVEQRVI